MDILVDLHTHTIASGHHTLDTITKLSETASNKQLKYLGITDHTSGMLCGAKPSYFNTLKMLSPKSMYGVKLLYGAETNILNSKGDVDLPTNILQKLDYTIASLHYECFKPSTERENTNAIINVMQNKYINIIGHPDNSEYSLNFAQICECAKETNTIIELNSESVDPNGYRGNNYLLCKSLIEVCKKYDVYISLGSDSHGCKNVGNFTKSLELLNELNYPINKIVNYDMNLFFKLVNDKRS